MDYKKLYTPSEAATLYNVSKIKYDPTSYSLKGNLILNCNHSDLCKQHIGYFSYDTEYTLVGLITSAEKRTREDILGMSLNKAKTTYRHFSIGSTLAVQQDNLYINLEFLGRYFDLKSIKHSKIMNTLVTLCIALNSNKSCAKDLLWLAFPKTQTDTYSNAHTFSRLKSDLSTPKSPLSIINNYTDLDPTYAPTTYPGVRVESGAIVYSRDRDCNTLYAHVIASFELMWAIRNLIPEYKDCFEYLCNKSTVPRVTDCAFFKRYFKFSGSFIVSPDLEKAISLSNPEERYSAYQELLAKDDVYADCIAYYAKDMIKDLHILNPFVVAFTSFIIQLSMTHIRINTVRILYEYCKSHGYLKNEDLEEYSSESALFFDKMSGTSLTKTEPDDKALMDLDTGSKTKGTPSPDVADDDTPLFEALDKARSSFKSGKYSFDTHDVIDTSSEYKAKYDAIASKVSLVNKLLTRRIKDIKTYNTGGKNSGASSGRLDRKAIYRYKYDPNIFYNNTYKTLESDLAFGIILDESGSMCGSGIENGRTTMIVLHETLKALGINHSIVGHTSDGKYHSEITRYQAFQEDKTYTTCKNYAIVETRAKSGNCDSGALYYMEKALDRVRNKDKICLIFSDGAPTECTGTDLRQQVEHMEKKGIKVIGIGINFESIAKYYKEYANGRNLTDMLNIIANILEEYVLKRKDK